MSIFLCFEADTWTQFSAVDRQRIWSTSNKQEPGLLTV